jgi:hypothetical protein
MANKAFRVYFENYGHIDILAEDAGKAEGKAADMIICENRKLDHTSGWEMTDNTCEIDENGDEIKE